MFDLHRDTAMGLTMCDVTGHTLSESCLLNNRIHLLLAVTRQSSILFSGIEEEPRINCA